MKVDITKTYTFALLESGTNGVMPKNSYPSSFTIPGEDTILDVPVLANGELDTTNAVPRKIRYVKGSKSIFIDEQPEDAKAGSITIANGVIAVPGRNQALVQYLMTANYCKNSNTSVKYHENSWYRHVQPEDDAKHVIDKQRKKINLKAKIMNMPFTDLKHFALALDSTGTMVRKIYDWDVHQIQQHLLRLADRNANLFDIDFKSDNVFNKVVLLRGVQEGFLEYTPINRTLKWANTGALIKQAPMGENPIDEIALTALDNADYASIIKDLARKMNVQNLFSPIFLSEAEEAKPQMEYDPNVGVYRLAINEALEAGVMELKAGLYYYGNVKGKLETMENKLKSDSALFIKLLAETEEG